MIIKKIKNNYWLLIWGIFYIYLLFQHNLVWMHIDDYGYASLNYAVSVNTSGNNYTILDIFRYLFEHYVQWGGRVLFYGIAILVYHFGGLIGMRFFQSTVILVMYYTVFSIVTRGSNKTEKTIISIISCLLYGVFQIEVVNCGVYWFSASSGYVWPILVVFCASYYLYRLIESEDFSLFKWLGCSLLWLVSAFSQEQIAVASIVICFMLCMWGIFIRHSTHKTFYLLPSISAIIGAGIMLLAPGNFGRLNETSDKSLLEQIKNNVPVLLGHICGVSTRIFLTAMFVCFLFVTISLIKRVKKKSFQMILRGVFLFQMLLLCILLASESWIAESGPGIRMALIMLIVLSVVCTCYYLIITEAIWAFCCFVGAISCFAAMAVVPATPIRIYIPFMLLMLPAMIVIMKGQTRSIYSGVFLIPLSLILIFNMGDIYKGYKLNDSLQEANWNACVNYNGEGTVQLKKMYNDVYTASLSYMDGYKWADGLLCKYFEIPEDTLFVWEESYCVE